MKRDRVLVRGRWDGVLVNGIFTMMGKVTEMEDDWWRRRYQRDSQDGALEERKRGAIREDAVSARCCRRTRQSCSCWR